MGLLSNQLCKQQERVDFFRRRDFKSPIRVAPGQRHHGLELNVSKHLSPSASQVTRARVLPDVLGWRNPRSQEVSAKAYDQVCLVESIRRQVRDTMRPLVRLANRSTRHGLVDYVFAILELAEELSN